MGRWLNKQFAARGEEELERFEFNGDKYYLVAVLKNDFFALTALYRREGDDCGIIVKTGREAPFFSLPFKWLGALLCGHELKIHSKLEDLNGIPKILGWYGQTGFVYKYVEGYTLDENPSVPEDFFDNLKNLLENIHRWRIAYLDLNKRGNVIVGTDGKPYLIDFQTSIFLPWQLFSGVLKQLQMADIYHLHKHKHKFCSHLMTNEDYAIYKNKGFLIRLHRCIATPYKKVRRKIFKYLYRNSLLDCLQNTALSPENDPSRFLH